MNPLTYLVDGLRAVLHQVRRAYGKAKMRWCLSILLVLLLAVAAKLYPRVIC
jgi:ABC-type multidrug transport system permease subunit